MALQRIDISKQGDEWVARSGGQVVNRAGKKLDLVRRTASSVRASGQPTSVRIHGRDGRIQEERTYGKGADPRRSRG
ncbi:MAG: DUF2188 domain-containing protein [Acidimicrobiales bacterium]